MFVFISLLSVPGDLTMPPRLGTMGDVCSIVQTSNLLSFYVRGRVQRQVGGRGDRSAGDSCDLGW